MLKKALNKVKKYFPIIFTIAIAAVLRFYMFSYRTSFDADQEEIAFKAKELLSGNPVLLGPKTSLGGFSIGPGFTYIWSFFSLLVKGDPIAGAYASIFLGIIFIIGTYIIGRKIFSEKVGLILSLIVAVSNCLVVWDQNPWAPSLFYLSELITFYGAYIARKSRYGILIIILGLILGFQSHFAVFLLIIPLVIYLLIYKPIMDKKILLISLIICILGISPVVLYDATHGFLNFGRLISIFSLGTSGVAVSRLKLVDSLIFNSTNILWFQMPNIVRYVVFGIISVFGIYKIFKDKKYRPLIILIILFIFVPLLTFMFYRSNFTEYYLMTAVVPFIFLLGYLISLIKSRIILIMLLILFSTVNLYGIYNIKKPMSLGNKEKIIEKIIEMQGKEGYGISLSTELGYSFGYSYLFDYYQVKAEVPPKAGEKKVFTIVAPPGYRGIEPLYQVEGIGLRWEGI